MQHSSLNALFYNEEVGCAAYLWRYLCVLVRGVAEGSSPQNYDSSLALKKAELFSDDI